MHSWFLYRSALVYQNKTFKFFIQPAAKQKKCHKISFQIGCFPTNTKLFLVFHKVQTMLNITPPNRSFKLTMIILQKTLPLTLKIIEGIWHYPVQASLSNNFIPEFPNHRAMHEYVRDSFRMVFTKRAVVILGAQNISPNQEGSSAKVFIESQP